MKHFPPVRITRLTLLVGLGCLVAFVFILSTNPLRAVKAGGPGLAKVGVAAPPVWGVVALPSAITCTLQYTTTDTTLAGTSPTDSNTGQVGSIPDLSLVGDVGSSQGTAPVTEHWFRLDNATIGATYVLQALPDYTNNYNLGIVVYGSGPSYTPIVTDANAFDNNSASVTLVPDSSGPYFFKVFQITNACFGGTYRLSSSYAGPTATPTNTPTTTSTPTTTPTPTPTTQPWTSPDLYDSSTYAPNYNETMAYAVALAASTTSGLTLYNAVRYPADPGNDEDWFTFYGVTGYQYSVIAAPDSGFVNPYLFLEVTAPDEVTSIGQRSDNLALSWTASSTGSYFIHIKRATSSSPTNGTYHITWTTNAPTTTPTPTPTTASPTETPVPGLDAFEPNYWFDHAAGIGLNVKYTNINFVPLSGQSRNTDFFKLRVKSGMLVTCETLDLSPGTDTNMIVYSDSQAGSCKGPSVEGCEALAGNDDVDRLRGDLRSRVTVSVNFDGLMYVVVGQGFDVPPSMASQYTYSLQCTSGQTNPTATPTATPAPVPSTSTPLPPPTSLPSPTSAPTPPATSMPPISVRPLPTSTPASGKPAQQSVTADLYVYYDVDENGVADPGEGVVGLPARVYDEATGALLAQGFTDSTGHALFNVASAGSVLVVVPYLGFEAKVPPNGATIPVRISPRELPERIP